ncbi:hypothetical protein [Novosphingobium sp. PhB165]|uniref:hypothetical protein n=1 Tax=Novosphingobium sp. PhB165 TaxID=2485105 RepID=UPI0010443FD3|nr:hypothetical protein [Novosphingobium sp. PhB165]
MPNREALIQYYRKRREGLDAGDGNRWYCLIKEIRAERGCSLEQAHSLALSDPIWRRWLEQRINNHPQCRKSALRHIRMHGEAALIHQIGDKLTVR